MFDYKLLEALAAVLQQGNFEKAAQSLAITQSAISQRIKLLEQRVGRPLLIRGTPVTPTLEGQQLLRHVQQVQLLEKDLHESFQNHAEPTFSRVRMAVNADSLATWLPEVLQELFRQKILIELEVLDQDKTHEALRKGQVMGCITSLDTPHQGCRSVYLGSMEYISVATPDFIRHYSDKPFSQIPTIHFDRDDELQNQFLKQYFGLNPGEFPSHILPSVEAILEGALRGIAYVIVPRIQAETWLKSGELAEMSPGKTLDIPLYWHHWSLEPELLKQVTQAICQSARRNLS